MQKAGQSLRKFLTASVMLIAGGQIVLGLLWACANFGVCQRFGESAELLDISRTWILDEYVGVLYPALIKASVLLGGAVGVPYYSFLYVIQLAAAFASGIWFLHQLLGGPDRARGESPAPGSRGNKYGWLDITCVFGSLYMMTVPMILQCHMAVLPQSLGLSLFLLLAAQGIALLRNTKWEADRKAVVKAWLLLCTIWIACGMNMPEYLWLGSVPVFFCLLVTIIRWLRGHYRRGSVTGPGIQVVAGMLALLLGAGSIWGLQQLTGEQGSRGRMANTFSAAALRRLVWPNFGKDSYFWVEPVWQVFELEELQQISLNPEAVMYEFGPRMEAALGRQRAEELYWNMAGNTWRVRTKEVASDIAQDLAGYACPHISTGLQLSGMGVSLNGWNYSRMNAHVPLLTKYYVRFSLIGFYAAAVFSMVLLLWRAWAGRGSGKQPGGNGPAAVLLCLSAGGTQVVWYTLSAAGMQDYKNVLFVCALWAAGIVAGGSRYERTDGSRSETFKEME